MISETNVPQWVRLGELIYNVQQDSLIDAQGNKVSLRPQSRQVLSVLVANLGQTVEKDTLITSVWPDISVTDDSLTQCIADVRRALNDVDRRILQTRPKVGYLINGVPEDINNAYPQARSHDTPQHYLTSNKATWVSIDGISAPSDGGIFDIAPLVQRASSQGSGQLITAKTSGAVFEFSDPFAALRFALALCASPRALTYRVGVDLVPKRLASAPHDAVDTGCIRIASLTTIAQAGEVISSIDVRDQCNGELDFDFEDLGHQTVESAKHSVRAYRVRPNKAQLRLLPNLAAEDLLPTIAIIPLTARLPAPETQMVGEIIADDLIAAMSRSADINVISRLSTTAFREQTANLDTMGSVLGADFVLSGTFVTQDSRIAMMLEFSEVSSSKVLWSERVEVDLPTLISGLDAVDGIVAKIRKAIALNEVKRARANPLSTLRNYSLLIGAVGLMHRLGPTDFDMAGDMLRTLIDRSPDEPAALSWMARWHVLRVQQGWSDDPQKEAQLALGCSMRALDIDPENALALTSEGLLLTNLLHQLDEAEDRYDAALEANPNDANGRLLRGTLFAFQGKGDAAKRDSERALHLAPLDPHRFFFLALAAGANLAANDYERAIVLAKASLRMNRTHTSTLRVKAVAQMRLGDGDAARETTQELMRLQPNLRVGAWLKNSPSAGYEIGQSFAATLRELGVPE